jgi:hypothetical protein
MAFAESSSARICFKRACAAASSCAGSSRRLRRLEIPDVMQKQFGSAPLGREPSNTRYGYAVPTGPSDHTVFAWVLPVIASEAKQSRSASAEMDWIASSLSLLAMTQRELRATSACRSEARVSLSAVVPGKRAAR